MEAELNLDPDPNPDPESDPELITDLDPNLQIISDPAGSGSGCTTLLATLRKQHVSLKIFEEKKMFFTIKVTRLPDLTVTIMEALMLLYC